MSLEKVFKDFGFIGISRILISISGIVMLPVLTKNLGASGYGLWVQATATIGIALPVIRLGLPYSMVRIFPGRDDDEISKDFYSILTLISLISGLVSFLLFLFPGFLANLIFEGEKIIVRLLAMILFVWCIDKVFMSVFRAFREMKTYGILNVVRRYGEIGIAIFFVVFLGYGVKGALISYLIVRVILLLVLIIMIVRRISLSIPDLSRTREYLEFGIPTIPGSLSHWVVSTSDRYLIGFFLGSSFVGYYSPGYTLGKMVPWMLWGVFGFILPSNLSKFYEDGDLDKVKRVMDLSLRVFLFLSLPYLFGSILVGEQILMILSTPSIAENGAIIIPFTALTGLVFGIRGIFNQFIVLKKKTKLLALTWIIASIVNFIGNLFLVPRLGIIAAAITTLTSYSVALMLIFYFVFYKFGFRPDITYEPILKFLMSSIIMSAILIIVKTRITMKVYILVPLGVLIYFSSAWLIGGIKQKEINFLKNLISNK